MTLLILLIVVGLVLLGFEVIIPGGLLGVLGAMALIAGCVVAFVQHGASTGAITTVITLGAVGGLLIFEFVFLPRTPWGRRMFLRNRITGTAGSAERAAVEAALVGREAVAVTTLAPSGYVTIDGKRHEAFCRSGFAESGTMLKVVGKEAFRLIVSIV